LQTYLPPEVLAKGLDSFRNTKDEDIENFLRCKAELFERRHWCATYLLIDAEKLANNELFIEGYFTLSNSLLHVSKDLSISKTFTKKLFDGLDGGASNTHVVLIGQLGKYIDESSNPPVYGKTSMKELLDEAVLIVQQINEKIPSRKILLECKEAEIEATDEMRQKRLKLHLQYQNYGFKMLCKRNHWVQYVLII